ncbi:MAG TPA: hypothetical protein VJB12_03555, partial [Candidatus Nanoarchaeia archaeon]|nr:hypothetical protein [Candidatus Nanoarchaeia archaeon]
LQLAEILPSGDYRIIMQNNPLKDALEYIQEPTQIFSTISLYTGLSRDEIVEDLRNKVKALQWMVGKGINDVDKIGLIMSRYYQNKPFQNVV